MHATLNVACAAAVLAVSGCATFERAGRLDRATLNAINNSAPPQSPAFETLQQPYLLGTPVAVKPQAPEVLGRDITMDIATPRPLREIAARISAETGIPIDVEVVGGGSPPIGSLGAIPALPAEFNGSSIPPPPPLLFNAMATSSPTASDHSISVMYHGPCSGLLDYVSARSGVSWKFENGRVLFFDVESKTFEIPALAWQVASKGSIVASSGASNSGSTGSAGGGGTSGSGSSSGGTGGSSTGSTEIDNIGVADVWKNLQKVAETVTGGARVVADASLGTVTVTGTPAQIAKAAAWAKDLTTSLTKEVTIEVHVYTIKLSEEQNYGFTPTLAFKSVSGKLGLNGSGPSVPVAQSAASPLTFGGTILSGPFNGTGAMVQALATLGTVTQDYEQTAVTLNGQPVPIQVGQQTGYLASTSTTQSANVGSTQSLTPGFVTTGFTGLFVPRVAAGRILLGMNVTISSLLSLTTESNGSESIQVPTTANSTFQQSVALESGSTLLLTGFKNANADTARNGVFSPLFSLFGGGGDASVNRQLIAIVINARTL